ncbi:MAG: transglycosylase SLT domain-containing protein [Bacteroidales bacterium]
MKKRTEPVSELLGTMKLRVIIPFLSFALFLLYSTSTNAGIPAVNLKKNRCSIVEMIDGLKHLKIFAPQEQVNPVADSSITKQDIVYEYYVTLIGKQSPVDFDYNQYVRKYIDIYTTERQEQVSQMLGLARMYFPLFEEYLDKYQLPLELKYLAVVESALNPMAVSKTGSVGLWQFNINTARMFNLNVSSFVDERMDPIKSTEAACQYLQYLFRTFNSWQLAIAAYNVGPGAINNAIERSGGELNFWKLYHYLPEAAQNYVPAFIAAAYIMQNYANHNIPVATPLITYSQTDTVLVNRPASFLAISSSIDVPVEIIRFLNPTYKLDYIPENVDPQTLRLPVRKTVTFIHNQETIYANTEKPKFANGNKNDSSARLKVVHTVRSGESMHKIAIMYGCTVEDIQGWNPKIDSTLSVGQNILIWTNKTRFEDLNIQN